MVHPKASITGDCCPGHKHDQTLQATEDRKACDQHKSSNPRQAEFHNRQRFARQRDSHQVGAAS
jgi:hypothetical protein